MKCLSLRLRLIIIKKKQPFSKLFTFTETWENAILTLHGKCYMGNFLFWFHPNTVPCTFFLQSILVLSWKTTVGENNNLLRDVGGRERRTAHPVLHEGQDLNDLPRPMTANVRVRKKMWIYFRCVCKVGGDATSVDGTFSLLERCFEVAAAAGTRDLPFCSEWCTHHHIPSCPVFSLLPFHSWTPSHPPRQNRQTVITEKLCPTCATPLRAAPHRVFFFLRPVVLVVRHACVLL